ncbi:Hypothetical predicted protein [Pelobates cultripes]|uniref:Uncharacterized protein n=1 Tax=Pelobates cultripes TaxID=61616 RepID=A0AAD1SYA3_PELCU|nr:Hypothetical predicted protein [Pelobates cultripes]
MHRSSQRHHAYDSEPSKTLEIQLRPTATINARSCGLGRDKGEGEAADRPTQDSLEADPKEAEDRPRAFLSPPPPVRDVPTPTAYLLQTPHAPETDHPWTCHSKMADAKFQSTGVGTSGDPATQTMKKLDELFAAFWARITERKLKSAPTKQTSPVSAAPAASNSKSRCRVITVSASPRGHGRHNWRRKRRRRACSPPSIHLHFKPSQFRTGPEAISPPGKH